MKHIRIIKLITVLLAAVALFPAPALSQSQSSEAGHSALTGARLIVPGLRLGASSSAYSVAVEHIDEIADIFGLRCDGVGYEVVVWPGRDIRTYTAPGLARLLQASFEAGGYKWVDLISPEDIKGGVFSLQSAGKDRFLGSWANGDSFFVAVLCRLG